MSEPTPKQQHPELSVEAEATPEELAHRIYDRIALVTDPNFDQETGPGAVYETAYGFARNAYKDSRALTKSPEIFDRTIFAYKEDGERDAVTAATLVAIEQNVNYLAISESGETAGYMGWVHIAQEGYLNSDPSFPVRCNVTYTIRREDGKFSISCSSDVEDLGKKANVHDPKEQQARDSAEVSKLKGTMFVSTEVGANEMKQLMVIIDAPIYDPAGESGT